MPRIRSVPREDHRVSSSLACYPMKVKQDLPQYVGLLLLQLRECIHFMPKITNAIEWFAIRFDYGYVRFLDGRQRMHFAGIHLVLSILVQPKPFHKSSERSDQSGAFFSANRSKDSYRRVQPHEYYSLGESPRYRYLSPFVTPRILGPHRRVPLGIFRGLLPSEM